MDQRQQSLIEAAVSYVELALITQQTPATAQPQDPCADGEERLRHLHTRDRPGEVEAGSSQRQALAGAGLTSEDVEAGAELELGALEQGQVADGDAR